MSTQKLVDLSQILAERERLEAEHRASCDADECDRCARWLCATCRQEPVVERGRACWTCSDVRRWSAFWAATGVPERFAWASFQSPLLALRCSSPGSEPIEQHRIVDDGAGEVERASTRRRATRLPAALRAARDAALAPLVIFAGARSGAGKTSLAVATMRERAQLAFAGLLGLSAPPTMRFVSAFKLATARNQHALGVGEAPLVADALAADLLVIDDLGAEPERAADVLLEVISSRHEAEKALWVTTFLTATEIGKRYGGGAERRLVDGAKIIKLGATG